MGGNALEVESVHLRKNTFLKLSKKMKQIFPYGETIRSYRNKETFGDLDFLYPIKCGYGNIEKVKGILGENFTLSQEPVKNGDVTSYGIILEEGIFQVDFIGVPNDRFCFAENYFAHNDMGNLLGRVARSAGVKLGHLGLFYIQRSPDNGSVVLKEHLLTSDWDIALSFLGYSTNQYHEGFDSLENIFEFVMSSPYYTFDKFDLTKRNRKARTRDSKRPNYRAFLEYATSHPRQEFVENTLQRTFNWFPNFEEEYHVCESNNHLNNLYKKKYNGDVVRAVTGLEGKELGEFMSALSKELTRDVVLQLDEKYVEALIDLYYRDRENNESVGVDI